MTAKHTPGPWRLEPHMGNRNFPDRVTSWVIYSEWEDDDRSPDDPIGEIYGPDDADEREANALHILEALTVCSELRLTPRQLADQRAELLEALENITNGGTFHTDGFCDCCGPLLKAARAAIQKARSE